LSTGASPTTFEITTTYSASVEVGWSIFKVENNFFSKNALSYSLRCNFFTALAL
jgi:hypothetical protein